MGKKHYSQSIKDEAVLFYELGHSFAETQAKYGMAESTFFTWKQKFDKAHPMHEAITTNRTTCHKSKRHLEKLALELEVLRQCPCGRNASIDEKVAAVNALRGRYSIHVLCDIGIPFCIPPHDCNTMCNKSYYGYRELDYEWNSNL